jgi:hypothetical protein
MTRTDGTSDEPFLTKTNKAVAFRIARDIAKNPSWDCVALWVQDDDGNGIKKFPLPEFVE